MPKRKAIRQRTNSVRKKPLRDEQEQYRHSHGLSSLELSVRHCFQCQMTACNLASFKLSKNIAELLTLSTIVDDTNLMQEISILRTMQSSIIAPIENYYYVK